MPQSNRIPRTNEDIQRVLASILRSIKDPRVNQGMISVTAADATSDLKYCKVYLSVLGLQSEKEFMRGLKSASGFVRRELSASLKLRNTPELIFHLDKSIEYGAHINALIGELNIPEDSDESDEQ
jgi:ribosome-binding factor A